MSVKFNAVATSPIANWPRWVKLEDPTYGSLEVLIHKPSYEQQIQDTGFLYAIIYRNKEAPELAARQWENRLQVVTAWQGVEGEDGNPVPFSQEKLRTLLGVYPAMLQDLTTEIQKAYRGMSADEVKNLKESQDATSSDTKQQTQP